MFKSVKRVSTSFMALIVLTTSLAWTQPQAAMAADPVDLKLDVKSAILMEASTGQVLYELNADEALPPASMAKMMTEYLVMDAVKNGKIKMTDMVNTTANAATVIGSGDLLAENEKATVKDMFSAMSIYSGNDASVALAEFLEGTEENFAKKMNEKAREMGMSQTANFINATGLSRADMKAPYVPKEIQGETLMTARDAAILAYNIVKDHKDVLDFTKIPSQKFRPTDKAPMVNWNWMLEGNKDILNFKRYAYPGLDGLKTGHTNEAGWCFTGTAERDGIRLISVIMGAKTEPKRFEESRKILDYGFNNFQLKQVLTAKSEIDSLKTVHIKKGVELQVPVVTQTGLNIVAKKDAKPEEFVVTAEPVEASKLEAPIQKDQVLGIAKVTYNGKEYPVNLIATQDVEKGGWFRLFFRAIKNFFVDMLGGTPQG
ncbi:D-alanyl-D-alanine carboxypeptidase family protein [Paenibacillus silviterrae]|uniref:D-alanyl-D-alanine carboxypeptidase family protein n=1 Tax=Paenibacillus silviterrae TaxID=3242194 RepID=UPI0025430A58|nr:D-alanyl-D-alanine carboxypeptidase family protein [Paenibacillus chinjuensis]